jgi:hypothetical protein
MKNVVLSRVMVLYLCNVRKIYLDLFAIFRLHTPNQTEKCHNKRTFV